MTRTWSIVAGTMWLGVVAAGAHADHHLEAAPERDGPYRDIRPPAARNPAAGGAPAPARPRQPADGREGLLRFKNAAGALIVVDGAIGGLPRLNLLIDTGTYRSIIDRAIARKLALTGTPDEMLSFGRPVEARRVAIPSLQLGPIRKSNLEVLAADLQAFAAQLGIRPDAVIGLDVLRGSCFVVDYEARTLALGCASAWERGVSFNRDSPYLVLTVAVDGHSYRLVMDTGSEAIVIYDRAIPASRRGRGERWAEGRHIGGTERLEGFPAESLRVGGQELGRRDVFVMPNPPEDFGFDGVFGARLLSSRLQIDLARMVLGWDGPERAARPD